jgi:predicted RecA/RadA family phage recombinase
VDTYVEPGEVLEFTAPSGGVVSGGAYLIGSLLVVAAVDAAQTVKFNGASKGVFDLPKVEDEAWSELLKLYWDNSAKKVTSVSSGNTLVGVALPPFVSRVVSLATNGGAALTISGMVLTVVTFGALAGKTVTVTIDGVATVLTEGVDWTAATANSNTATSLAAAIDALAGVNAVAVSADVTVTPGTGPSALISTTGRVRLDGAAR